MQLQPSIIINLITPINILMESWKGKKNALIGLCLDEGKKTCRGSGNQRIYVYRHCIQEIFSFLLLTSCLWEHAPFSLSALTRLLTVDNTETNSAGCTLILSTSTNARKFTHAHSHRLNCRDEILSFTEMFRFQNTLCGWVTFFFLQKHLPSCAHTQAS